MEEINCSLCGADDTELVYVEKDRLMRLPGSFRLVRCRQCGLLYLNPRPTPDEIKYYYPDDYGPYNVTPGDDPSWISRLDDSFGYWKRARIVNNAYPQGGRVLDVGCAMGNFLDMLRRLGPWELYGLDITPEATLYAHDRYGVNTFTGALADAAYPDAYFDVVTMWDVLEHVFDPTSTLNEIHRILKPQGLLLIRVPNVDTWDARLFGRYWAGYDAPRHTFVFSPETLGVLLDKTGFQASKMQSLVLSYSPFALSVQFWLDEKVGNERLRRVLLALNRSRLPRLLTLPIWAVLRYFNATFAMTVFATKVDGRARQSQRAD